jgi:hypothetical protein
MLLVLAPAAIAVALYAAARFEPVRKEICAYQQGKWGGACFTRSCYESNSCGHWLRPSVWCNRLKPGDALAEVYFQLGEPDQIEGNRYGWYDGKLPDEPVIWAVIERGELVSLTCPRGTRSISPGS